MEGCCSTTTLDFETSSIANFTSSVQKLFSTAFVEIELQYIRVLRPDLSALVVFSCYRNESELLPSFEIKFIQFSFSVNYYVRGVTTSPKIYMLKRIKLHLLFFKG